MGLGGSKNITEDVDRVLIAGKPDYNRCDNMITTSKYTVWSFLPLVRGLSTDTGVAVDWHFFALF